MHIIYQFSPSSIPNFQRCIEISERNGAPNEWNQRFSRSSLLIGYDNVTSVTRQENTQPTQEKIIETANNIQDFKTETECLNTDKYKELISNPVQHFNYILEESVKDESILIELASNLSDMYVEKFCQYIFENNLETTFVENFTATFLPQYFRRQNTCSCLDILAKVYQIYPVQFKLLLQKIILDIDINSIIFQEFISTLNSDQQTDILKHFFDSDMSVDVFIRHIFAIYTLYKNSSKDEKVQNFILNALIEASETCTSDKQYGRFLLLYLQNKNDNFKLADIQKIVENHRSAFRRPCLNVLNDILINN